jgi:hypothetical protein
MGSCSDKKVVGVFVRFRAPFTGFQTKHEKQEAMLVSLNAVARAFCSKQLLSSIQFNLLHNIHNFTTIMYHFPG